MPAVERLFEVGLGGHTAQDHDRHRLLISAMPYATAYTSPVFAIHDTRQRGCLEESSESNERRSRALVRTVVACPRRNSPSVCGAIISIHS
jgi:hypothetical protein